MSEEITDMSASQLSRAIKRQEVSCVETMTAYLRRINQYNSVYNAIVSMGDDTELIRQAERADNALSKGEYWGWMHGMPHAVKDLSDARGIMSSYGSPIFAGTIPKDDSLPIARIRGQGAIFIGKTNTPEFGLGSQTYNPVFGATRNAFNPKLTAGGSSGGAAVGLATQMLPVADGSDMMGSLRNPAGFNNVIGFRPSQGIVPNSSTESNAYYEQLSTNGPMGRTMEDTIRLLGTMAGHNSSDLTSRQNIIPSYEQCEASNLNAYRIGWMGNYQGYLAMESNVLLVCESALDQLSDHGSLIENCMPECDMHKLWETWLTLRHCSMTELIPLFNDPATKYLLKPELHWEIEGSLKVTDSQISEANTTRSNWCRVLQDLFKNYDLLALPAAQVFPFLTDINWPKNIGGTSMDTYHRWMEVVIGGTLAGLPIVTLPAGFDSDGRPMGIQFMGPAGKDRKVLEFAMAYEGVTSYLAQQPKLRASINDPT